MPLLHWSPRSPYVRKVMVALHEKGLAGQVRTIRTHADPMIPHEGLMQVNPLSKIPTLELEDGQVLFDSHVICRWADRNGTGPVLFPEDPMAERDEALGTGLLDVALPWLVEARLRPEEQRSEQMIAAYRSKLNRVADWLEGHAPALAARPFDIGHLSIGVALSYLDFRFGVEDWRKSRPRLAEWHAGFAARPSVLATEFRDDPRPQAA
ncbi:glutathione S-transferase family protein [Paracoccus ravus]|uniref:glutathione S-transferase family protein n=1 Tax=Paracoccus ravus TaxID=2447760 RepID=UPI00106E8331|nr:glutathione S-transferase family protein [Paracoccus ravus]